MLGLAVCFEQRWCFVAMYYFQIYSWVACILQENLRSEQYFIFRTQQASIIWTGLTVPIVDRCSWIPHLNPPQSYHCRSPAQRANDHHKAWDTASFPRIIPRIDLRKYTRLCCRPAPKPANTEVYAETSIYNYIIFNLLFCTPHEIPSKETR